MFPLFVFLGGHAGFALEIIGEVILVGELQAERYFLHRKSRMPEHETRLIDAPAHQIVVRGGPEMLFELPDHVRA